MNDKFKIRCWSPFAKGELDFYEDDDLVPEKFIKVNGLNFFLLSTSNNSLRQFQRINDTHIELVYASAKPLVKNFTCRLNGNIIDGTMVKVDGPLTPVENFKCRTQDLANIHCSFKQPTGYKLPIIYDFLFAVNNGKVRIISSFN